MEINIECADAIEASVFIKHYNNMIQQIADLTRRAEIAERALRLTRDDLEKWLYPEILVSAPKQYRLIICSIEDIYLAFGVDYDNLRLEIAEYEYDCEHDDAGEGVMND